MCWNEERILPYFLDHYDSFVDEFHIYDNGSTDSSMDLLSNSSKVTVHTFETDGTFDDEANLNIKNNAWKESVGKADFVVVCDMDELLYHYRLNALIALLKEQGFTVLKPLGIEMVSESLPPYDGAQKITELITLGVKDEHNYSKTLLFDPNRVEINFKPGCHRSDPEGKVKIFHSDHAKLLHYKYIDREEILRKLRTYSDRLSQKNRCKGWGLNYLKSEEQTMAYYDYLLTSGKKVIS